MMSLIDNQINSNGMVLVGEWVVGGILVPFDWRIGSVGSFWTCQRKGGEGAVEKLGRISHVGDDTFGDGVWWRHNTSGRK